MSGGGGETGTEEGRAGGGSCMASPNASWVMVTSPRGQNDSLMGRHD